MQASYRQKCTLLPEAVCCCLQTCNRRFVMRVIYFIARKVEKLHKYKFTNCCCLQTCNSCMLIVVVGIALIQSFIVIGITTSL